MYVDLIGEESNSEDAEFFARLKDKKKSKRKSSSSSKDKKKTKETKKKDEPAKSKRSTKKKRYGWTHPFFVISVPSYRL